MIIALQTLLFFRESLVRVLDRLLRPYYKKFSLTFKENVSEDEDSEDQVFAEFDDEKGVIFFPPMYVQRYAAVSDCLMDEKWNGQLEKVVDFGYHDMSFIKYLKEVPGIRHVLGVDIETIPLQCSSYLLGCDEYVQKRETPLNVTLFQGNAADPDYRLIGCDAVIAIEMIEHMLPHDLDRFIHTVFGFIKPRIVVFTTPNGDFNVLFKSLERNGFRRLDHFFEWSRTQFNDWCSNIIDRYPQYTVACKGIGPGPSETLHLGCCSQLALFVAKDYHKQRDLDLNSLALVGSKDAPVPHPTSLSDMTCSFEYIPDRSMLCLPEGNNESYTAFPYSNKQSCLTIILSTSTFSYEAVEHRDKNFQCNLETEQSKSFLFEEESCDVLVARRKVLNKTYNFEDVNNRLNCSTLQVKKFSKTTQGLMAKNKIDSLVHTREVVDEIKHLTKMLNFNKNGCSQASDCVWHNFNWGENAPYWNQYYRIVRDYTYPFETKSDECRILDAISEEINRLIDSQFDDEFAVDVNRLEISIAHLMEVVGHITDDVHRVKDLLEWNGYQVVDDVVIHSRLVVDTMSAGSQEDEWLDNDILSDWDTSDVRSNSLSDRTTNVPDLYGRCLRRALDQKVRKLRTLLSADEDITSELDRVVCTLMKLALNTSKSRQNPPPTNWMQCKLFDLLTLTENAIERRRKHLLETYIPKAIEYANEDARTNLPLLNAPGKTIGAILNNYQELIYNVDEVPDDGNFRDNNSTPSFTELEDDNEYFKENIKEVGGVCPFRDTEEFNIFAKGGTKTKLEIVQEWIEDESKVDLSTHDAVDSIPDCQYESSNYFYSNDMYKSNDPKTEHDLTSHSSINSQTVDLDKNDESVCNNRQKIKNKIDDKVFKKSAKKKINLNFLLKNYYLKFSSQDNNTKGKQKKRLKSRHKFQPNISNPIPVCLAELQKSSNSWKISDFNNKQLNVSEASSPVSEDNDEININVTAIDSSLEKENIHANNLDAHLHYLREAVTDKIGQEETVIKITSQNSLKKLKECNIENNNSQTIFLYDINEPTTSKGIRRVGMDAQCGPDNETSGEMLSATTSFTKPKLFSNGIKISDSSIYLPSKTTLDTGTSPESSGFKSSLTMKNTGIWIHDSCYNMLDQYHTNPGKAPSMPVKGISQKFDNWQNNASGMDTQLIKSVASDLKTYESGSEHCCCVVNDKSLSKVAISSKNASDIEVQSTISPQTECLSSNSQLKPKLSCGGVFVHSFRDREESEDVVYQGGWQDIRPKIVAKKNPKKIYTVPKNNIQSKKISKKHVMSTNKEHLLESQNNKTNDANIFTRRVVQVRTAKLNSTKKEVLVKTLAKKNIQVSSSKTKYNKIKNVTKVSSKILVSPAVPKNAKMSLRRPRDITNTCKDTKNIVLEKQSIDKYLPPYLKKKLVFLKSNREMKNSSKNSKIHASVESAIFDENTLKSLKHSSTFQNHIHYQVYRNQVDNQRFDSDKSSLSTSESHNTSPLRSCSPNSQTSSCSSPNSVATIRAVPSSNIDTPEQCLTTCKDIIKASGCGVSTPRSLHKINDLKKAKNSSTYNKENIPVAKDSGKFKNISKSMKGGFAGKTSKVFRAQINDEKKPLTSAILSNAHTSPNAALKLSYLRNSEEETITMKKNDNDESSSIIMESHNALPPLTSDMVIVIDPRKEQLNDINLPSPIAVKYEVTASDKNLVIESRKESPTLVKYEIVSSDSSLEFVETRREHVTDNINLSQTPKLGNYETKKSNKSVELVESKRIMDDIKCSQSYSIMPIQYLSEENVNMLSDDKLENINVIAESVIISEISEANKSNVLNSNTSILSYNTTIVPSHVSNLKECLENAVENSLQNNNILDCMNPSQIVLDSISFESVGTSKLSEYFLADCQFNVAKNIESNNVNPVLDIYDRKENHETMHACGPVALQVFSGLSIDGMPIVGDQQDFINLVDSETGSLLLNVARQTASEELLLSGRSSDTYESCLVDDEVVVPSWLFNMLNQQFSSDSRGSESEDQEPLVLPVVEPIFDLNENPDLIGAGAGAGDGRGMHSDQSQESSGRGTSLSSSDTSTDPQSEVVLVDPSAFLSQFEYVRDGTDRSNIDRPGESPDTSFDTAENDLGYEESQQVSSRGRNMTSDVDADISSLDTDMADSDA